MAEDIGYVAEVTVNRAGRIISADRKFRRMFSFPEGDDPEWHYITDFVGGPLSWGTIRDTGGTADIRARNRRGRSFACRFTLSLSNVDGQSVYSCTLAKT